MQSFLRTAATIGFVISLIGLQPTVASAETPAQRVRTALQRLNDWRAPADNKQAWGRFLKTDQLQQELDKGQQADAEVVTAVLAQFSSGVTGLDHAKFAAVREALQSWAAELNIPAHQRLRAAARASKVSFTPIGDAHIRARRSQLRRAMNRLDRFLARGGPDTQNGWKRYLRWNDLLAQVDPQQQPDAKTLQTIGGQYFKGADGLELAEFVAVRDALQNYHAAVANRTNEEFKEQVESRLDALADVLAEYAEPEPSATHRVEEHVVWLQRSQQAGHLTRLLRREYSRPNFLLQASEQLISAGIDDEVDDTTPLSDRILGTRIRGTGRTVGQVQAYLAANNHGAALEIVLTGTTNSNTVGRNGPVTIYTTGVTEVTGRKRIVIGADGLQPEPATAYCRTSTNINGISAGSRMGSRLIEKIAWRRAGTQKGQAERIASGRAAGRVARRMDEQSRDFVRDANDSLLKKLRRPLEHRNAYPRSVRFHSTDDHLFLTATQASAMQLAAPNKPPAASKKNDLAVRLHESVVNNTAALALAGYTLSDERLVEIIEEADREVPEELQISDDKDPWSITFAWQQPVTATFDDQTVRIAVRGRKFTRGEDQELKKVMEISARYQLEKAAGGARLVRQGDIEVDFPGREGKRLSVREVTFKTFMKKKFGAMFKSEFAGEGLQLPGRWADIGKLQLVELASQQGWLSLGWKMPGLVARSSEGDRRVGLHDQGTTVAR